MRFFHKGFLYRSWGLQQSIPPKPLKPVRSQIRVPNRVLDIFVPEIKLYRPGVNAVIGQFIASCMT